MTRSKNLQRNILQHEQNLDSEKAKKTIGCDEGSEFLPTVQV